jgi:hypothetical protein
MHLRYTHNSPTLTHTYFSHAQVLFAALQGREAFIRPPYHQLRHPLMFYYNHPAVLYINKLRVAGVLEEGIDQFFEQVSGEQQIG